MTKILRTVLSNGEGMLTATNSYIDDILVDEMRVAASTVVEHLQQYGLVTKQPEPLGGGSAAVCLRLEMNKNGELIFRRGNEIPEVKDNLSRRELFSICGKLVGHYPITGWLRVACSYVKRRADRGRWNAPKSEKGVIWCDASSIATGVILETGNETVEDGACLRKKDDYNHINVAEVDAVLKGINLALKWSLRDIEIRTDSATVSEKNKADVLTRVKKTWLGFQEEVEKETSVCCAGVSSMEDLHKMHHMRDDRTLYLARKIDPTITRDKVRRVVRYCSRCQSIDPAPTVHEAGNICVKNDWRRLAIDVTHYRQELYLSMVDCGPGRVAIWRRLRGETAEEISGILNELFLERGPVDEVLMDNSTAFRSQVLKNMLDKWNISRFFRAAYRPSGNGIVERHHRTIKVLAERSQETPMEAVFWYNMSPRSGQHERAVPQRAVFKYEWRNPSMPAKTLRYFSSIFSRTSSLSI
nr:uncharacterized protein LOC113825211 [Penaeus vannamei]